MKKPVIIKQSRATKVIAGKPGIQKSVKVQTPPVVTHLPAHERAARRRRILGDLPVGAHKTVAPPNASAAAIPATAVQHHVSY